jgi:hypothetical protein
MKTRVYFPSLLAAAIAISLAGPGAALADDNRRYHDRQDYGSHQYRQHSRQNSRDHYGQRPHYNRQHAYNKHDRRHGNYKKKHHYKKHHNNKYYNNRHNYYYGSDDDDDSEKLLIGLVLGGLIGYAINNAYDPYVYGD